MSDNGKCCSVCSDAVTLFTQLRICTTLYCTSPISTVPFFTTLLLYKTPFHNTPFVQHSFCNEPLLTTSHLYNPNLYTLSCKARRTHMKLGQCRIFPINLLLSILKEIVCLQKIYCYSLNKLRLLRWTRTIDQAETDNRAPQYIHIA